MARGRLTCYREVVGDAAAAVVPFELAADPKGRLWAVEDSYCANPRCGREETSVSLVTQDGGSRKETFRINLAEGWVTWDADPGPEGKALAVEFAKRRNMTRLLDRRRQIVRATRLVGGGRRAKFEPGRTYAILDFAVRREPFALGFEAEGQDWGALDHWCVTPGCGCGEAILAFYRIEPDRKAQKQEFAVRLDLATGSAREAQGARLSSERSRILESLMQELGDWRGELARRRDLLLRIAKSRLKFPEPAAEKPPAPQPIPVLAGGKPGRNDPCPCGSGRKFKRCCGA